MKIELTPAEAMDVYDILDMVIDDYVRNKVSACQWNDLNNVRINIRSAIIDNAANIVAFEKWYETQKKKVDALGENTPDAV